MGSSAGSVEDFVPLVREGQALCSVQHAEGHLQMVGVGEWKPRSTRPGWNTEPRLNEEEG